MSKFIISFTYLTNSTSFLHLISMLVNSFQIFLLISKPYQLFQSAHSHTLHYSYKTVVKIENNIFGIAFIIIRHNNFI